MPTGASSRCDEIVARTPQVILASDDTLDFTHLQRCGAPVTSNGKCARHQTARRNALARNWLRFVRRR